jgi:GTPase
MTHEHLALATALDVPFFITITKTDVTSPADTLLSLEAMLKSAGCRKVKHFLLCDVFPNPLFQS